MTGPSMLVKVEPVKHLDLQLEHVLRVVLATLRDLKEVPADEHAQIELCGALQEAKLRYGCLDRRHKPQYRAKIHKVLKSAQTAADRLPNGKSASVTVRSIRRHMNELRRVSRCGTAA